MGLVECVVECALGNGKCCLPSRMPERSFLKILIVRVSSLGDVLHNMPMVADLRRQYPHAVIDWVVEEAYVSLVRLSPDVRHVIPFALRRWRKSLFSRTTWQEIGAMRRLLQQEHYDVVFDTQGLLKTGAIMGLANVVPNGIKAGLANATEGSGYEPVSRVFHTMSIPVDPRTHAVARGRIVAAQTLGYTPQEQPDFGLQVPKVTCPVQPSGPFVLFFHGTAGASKKWDEAHWMTVGQSLAGKGLQVLLPWGSAAERAAAERLAAQIPDAQVLPSLTIHEAIVLIQQARLVIGLDTGLTHIAAAYCRPTIELYCDSPRWKTEGNWSPQIINLGDKGAPPTVAAVLDAVTRLDVAGDVSAQDGCHAGGPS